MRTGLHRIATEHAQPGTRIMGEEWLNENGEIVSTVSQPHTWEQSLFYLAALGLLALAAGGWSIRRPRPTA